MSSYPIPTILPIYNEINFPSNGDFLTVQDGNKYLPKTGGSVNSLSVLNSFKVNSNGTQFTNIQFGTYLNLSPTSIPSGSNINISITFPSAFSVGSTPKVILSNSSPATQGSIPALNYLLVSCQQVNISGFRLNITNTHPSVNFNDALSIDYMAFRDT